MLRITAYSSRISYAPGDEVDVKVSASGMASFRAELRRIVQGDINPDGPGYKDELVELDLGGPFTARRQEILPGSYGIVRAEGGIAPKGAFTVCALIWPTLPGRGRQAILSLGSDDGGLRLILDEAGAAAVELRDGAATRLRLSSPVACRAKAWYAVAVSVDPGSGRVGLRQIPLARIPGVNDSGGGEAAVSGLSHRWTEMLVAAEPAGPAGRRSHYNGKIEAPSLLEGDPGDEALLAHLRGQPGAEIIAAWDFSHDMANDGFAGRGPQGAPGRLVNLPHRAVTGARWDGSIYDWTRAPEQYAAVHFHDDDLYDAGWQTDLTLRLPADLRSGVYAVRLFSDDGESEYFVVFAVRAGTGSRTAPVAFVLPTASYMAYANHRLGLDVSETEIGAGQLLQIDRHHVFLQEHPEYGLSLYEVHSDGSGVFYSSRLRPVLDLQPKVQGFIGGLGSNIWQFNADTHILGFLEARGIDFDVLTDEDLDQRGAAALDGYRVVVTGTHPEYTSTRMLDACRAFQDAGGRIIYLGGNGFYWRVAYNPNLPGVIECRRGESGIRGWEPGVGNTQHQFTGELGGLWRRIGRAPQQLFGVGMTAQGFDLSSPYIRTADAADPRAAFIFAGVEGDLIGDYGLNGGGAAGNEIDRADMDLGTPPNALIVARSQVHTDVYLMTPEDLLDPTPTWSGTQSDLIRSDLTFFETASGGAVFSVGSIAWAAAMAWNGYDNDVARITENVVRRFIDPEPFEPV